MPTIYTPPAGANRIPAFSTLDGLAAEMSHAEAQAAHAVARLASLDPLLARPRQMQHAREDAAFWPARVAELRRALSLYTES